MTGLAIFGAVVLGIWVAIVMGFVLAEVRRAVLRRRDAAAWREIHGRVRDGIEPGEES